MDYRMRKKMMYALLREIDQGNTNIKAIDFDVSAEDFHEVIGLLDYEQYIKNVIALKVASAKHATYLIDACFITKRGMDYLEENSSFGKNYKALKEFREWLPF